MTIFGLKLSPDSHDLVIKNGQIEVIEDDEVIARNLETRLATLKGEWLLDKNYGFEYRDIFGARVIDLQLIESSLKTYILETEGVTAITVFKLEYIKGDARRLVVTFTVTSDAGTDITIGGVTIG